MNVTQLTDNRLENWMLLKAFQTDELSLRQLGKVLGKNKHETLELLRQLNILLADYDLQENLQTLDALFAA
jgi:predicted HTH domain antitoxin